jgi:drug/metabolite transporter (DMT)-like permease
VTTLKTKAALENGPLGSLEAAGGVALAGMLCWLLPARRRRLPAMLLWLLALGMTLNLGCSAGNFTTQLGTAAGTPLGTTLLVINTAGTNGSNTVRHNYTYQVTVQ